MEEEKVVEIIKQINMHIDMLANDTSVPKNVRTAINEAKNKLNAEGAYTIRIAGAIYSIDSISNDINLPTQARTVVWNILSLLESIKE